MNWVWFLSVAVGTSVMERIFHRIILKDYEDTKAYTFFYQASAAILLLSFSFQQLKQIEVSKLSFSSVYLMALQALFWSLFGYFSFRADGRLPASHSAIVSRLRMVWAIPLGILVFGEAISLTHLFGVALIFSSVVFLYYPFGSIADGSGTFFAVSASLSIAISLTIDKILTTDFPAQVVAVFSFLLSAVFMSLVTKSLIARTTALWRRVGIVSLVPAILGAISHASLVQALAQGPISAVVPVYQAGTVLTVVLGICFLKEHEYVGRKIVAVVVSYLGMYILTG